jgi:ribosomal protein L20A (L18A)
MADERRESVAEKVYDAMGGRQAEEGARRLQEKFRNSSTGQRWTRAAEREYEAMGGRTKKAQPKGRTSTGRR